jgi:hypothetical protein
MAKYLVEVPHSAEKLSCLRAIQIFLNTGNHFLVNAEWGCMDGVHKSWFIMDANSKDEVMMIIPPFFRRDTLITRLVKFDMHEVEKMLAEHLA